MVGVSASLLLTRTVVSPLTVGVAHRLDLSGVLDHSIGHHSKRKQGKRSVYREEAPVTSISSAKVLLVGRLSASEASEILRPEARHKGPRIG
jgi:hypothetical protein